MENTVPVTDGPTNILPEIVVTPEVPTVTPPPPPVANYKIDRYTYGLPGYPVEDIQDAVTSGDETNLRRSAAADLDVQNYKDFLKLVTQTGSKTGQPLTTKEKEYLWNQIQTAPLWTDPKSVLEEQTSKRYIQSMYGQDPTKTTGSWVEDVKNVYPQAFKGIADTAMDYMSKDEYIRNRLFKTHGLIENQTFGQKAYQIYQNVLGLGFRGQYHLRSNVKDAQQRIYLGQNLEEQRKQLYRLPYGQFKPEFDSVMDRLEKEDPELASEFGQSMLGMARSEIIGKDFETMAVTTNIPFTGTAIGRGLIKAGIVKDAQHLAADMVDAAAPPSFPTTFSGVAGRPVVPSMKIRSSAGQGDLGEVAVQTAITNNFSGKVSPMQAAIDQLPQNMKLQAQQVGRNIGSASRELVTRIQDAYEASEKNILKTIGTMIRGQQMPAPLATEEGIRIIKDSVRNNYPGNANRILEIEDPVREPFSNKWFNPIKIGRTTGEFFADRQEAEAAAHIEGIKVIMPMRIIESEPGKFNRYKNYTEYRNAQRAAGIKPKDMEIKNSIDFEAAKKKEGPPAKFNKVLPESKEGFSIEQEGRGFYISRHMPVDVTDPSIRAHLLTTPESKAPEGFLGSYLGWLRTGEETFSYDARLQAKIAVYGPNNLMKLAKEEAKEIYKLRDWRTFSKSKREAWSRFESAIKAGQTNYDPVTGKQGYLYNSLGELQEFYQRNFHMLPTDQESTAYFSFKRWVELDSVIRDIQSFKSRVAEGAELHNIKVGRSETGFLDGIAHKQLPMSGGNVLIMGTKPGQEQILELGKLANLRALKAVRDRIDKGELRVVELFRPGDHPLQNFGNVGDARVTYVVSDRIETKPMSFDRVPRNFNRYFETEHPFYIRQGQIRVDPITGNKWYNRDVTMLAMNHHGQAKDIVDKLNAVRTLLRDGKEDEARAIGRSLPIPWEDHRKWYEPTVDTAGKTIPARLSKEEPIHVVPHGQNVGMVNGKDFETRFGKEFKDGTRLGNRREVPFTSEPDVHDLYTIENTGTKANPLYNYVPAERLDPIPMMNRATARMARSLYMDDYKSFSIEHWIQQAQMHLNGSLSSIAESPAWHFYHGDLKSTTPSDVWHKLEDSRMKIKQILGTPSWLDQAINGVAQHMADSIYNKTGYGRWVPNRLDPSWMLPKMTDAGKFIRSATFHPVIGLFALPQLIVQNMTYVTIAGIEGFGRAIPGTHGALLHLWSVVNKNPAILDKLDNLASSLFIPGASRWRPGEWKEARELWERTGFGTVGREHSFDPLKVNLIENAGTKFLDAGQIFFRGGEKSARAGAWYTAYRRFRDMNPTGAITNKELGDIFERAEMLSGNMSNASKSNVQRGPMAFPTQFLSYNLRLIEQWTGKRITPYERGRLFLTYATFFGLPAGGLGLTGLPLGDLVRQSAIKDYGYQPGQEPISTTLFEGVPAALGKLITGQLYNVGPRYGSPSIDSIREILQSDKPLWRLLSGASGNMLLNTWEAGNPMRRAIASWFKGDNMAYPLKASDFVDFFRGISIVNIEERMRAAYNISKWTSRNGQNLEDIEMWDATLRSITGLTSVPTSDVHNKNLIVQNRDQQHLDTMKKASVQLTKYWQALDRNDFNNAEAYFKRFKVQLIVDGFPEDKYGDVVSYAAKGNENLVDRVDRKMYTKGISPEQKKQYRDIYTDILNRRGK